MPTLPEVFLFLKDHSLYIIAVRSFEMAGLNMEAISVRAGNPYKVLVPNSVLPSSFITAMEGPNENVTTVEQIVYPVPDIPIKDLLDAIPYAVFKPRSTFLALNALLFRTHCFKRSALRSSSYLWAASLDTGSFSLLFS